MKGKRLIREWNCECCECCPLFNLSSVGIPRRVSNFLTKSNHSFNIPFTLIDFLARQKKTTCKLWNTFICIWNYGYQRFYIHIERYIYNESGDYMKDLSTECVSPWNYWWPHKMNSTFRAKILKLKWTLETGYSFSYLWTLSTIFIIVGFIYRIYIYI